jgi:peptide/nickel transport system permease protein
MSVVTEAQGLGGPEVPDGGPPDETARRPRRRRRRTSRGTAITSLVFLGLVALVAIFPGVFAPGDPSNMFPLRALHGPSGSIPLGADQYGRSVLTLLIHGARSAAFIGLSSVVLATVIGGLLGLIAGYFGGWIDMVFSRIVDVLMCFPGVLLALLITAALGPSTRNVIIAVALATLPGFARIMRGQVLAVRSRLFIEAATATGLPQRRIVARYIVPNAIAPIVVLATISVGVSIVLAASLSYLGVGPQAEVPDWGQLLASGQAYMGTAWWISTFPGLALTLTVIAVSLLGDWLRDRLDVST